MSTCNRLDLETIKYRLTGYAQKSPQTLNQRLVTDEPVEFEKSPVEVGDFRRITDRFKGIYKIYPK